MKHIFMSFIFTVFHLLVYSQKENNIWCFGNNIGVDFNSGNPVSFPGVSIFAFAQEGTSSIADTNGSLLFYTDGSTVWNRNHAIMTGGTGLLGDFSSSQGALIVPKPSNQNLYYVFCLDDNNSPIGLHYSVVDMLSSGGLGSVTILNVQLAPGIVFSEKMIGIRDSMNTGFWLITHESNTDAFYSFHITSSGIGTPFISHTGQIYTSVSALGMINCTLDGSRIAAAYWYSLSGFELFDFNRNTGVLSNPLFITSPNYMSAYSCCFSPSGRYLYGACYTDSAIYQFDLTATVPTGTLVSSTSAQVGALQLGPDHRIYYTILGNNYLSCIELPDSSGVSCICTDNYLSVGLGNCQIGLPNYIYPIPVNLPIPNFAASQDTFCPGTCISFTNTSFNASSYQWSFPGGSPSSDTSAQPQSICYFNSGNYDVTLSATNAAGTNIFTMTNCISVYPQIPFFPISQIGDTLFSVLGYQNYQWYHDTTLINGAVSYYYIAAQNGNYSVQVTDSNGCQAAATIINVQVMVNEPEKITAKLNCSYKDGILHLNIMTKKDENGDFELTDISGRLIKRFKLHLLEEENQIDIPVHLSKGNYILRMTDDYNSVTSRLMIN